MCLTIDHCFEISDSELNASDWFAEVITQHFDQHFAIACQETIAINQQSGCLIAKKVKLESYIYTQRAT